MKKIILIFSVLFLLAISGYAQKNSFGVTWDINFPSNSDYLSKTSFSGAKLEWRHFFKENFSAGLALNWTTYEEYLPRQTFQKPDGSAVTSDFVAQAYQVPIMVTGHYYFKGSKLLTPFAGIALGAQYLQQSLYYNVYVSDDDNWGFAVRPEIGVIIKPGGSLQRWGILVGGNYCYGTNKTDLLNRDNFQNFGLNLGFVFWN